MRTYDELYRLIEQRGVHPTEFAATFGDGAEGFGIEQNIDELARFLVVLQQLEVTSVLEIGSGWRGGLARFLAQDMGWRVTSVDVVDYHHPHRGVEFRVLTNDTDADNFGQYDLVLIDGEHTYDAVSADYALWAKHATKVIAIHDICGLRQCEGVLDFWQEISENTGLLNGTGSLLPGYHQIIADSDQRAGIGGIVLSELAPKVDGSPVVAEAKPAPHKRAPAKRTAKKAAK